MSEFSKKYYDPNHPDFLPTDISAKAALREILMVCDEAPTEVSAWVVEIQEICRRVLKTLPP